MNNTVKELQFTQRQLLHCATINFPTDSIPLWDIINQELVQKYSVEQLTNMGQGVVSKVNSVIRKVQQYWVVNSSVNNNKSVECNWNGDTYYHVSPLVADAIAEYVSGLV